MGVLALGATEREFTEKLHWLGGLGSFAKEGLEEGICDGVCWELWYPMDRARS